MKIAHEAPLNIMMRVQEVTDYDYALVHLFEENEEYFNFFKRAMKVGREVILDNSVFELGTAFDKEKFYHWIEQLKPSYYIIPDVLEDAQQTVKNVKEWQHIAGSKTIGVVQGKSVEEIVWCYQEIEPLVDKVAISFDYSFFVNEDINGKLPTKFHHYMYGRDALLNYMLNIAQVINTEKQHHLLGCGLPQEFEVYRDYKWLDSVDTSNPVVAGLKGIRYNGVDGLENKPSEKLYTMIESKPTEDQYNMIMYNIEMFRSIVNG